MLPFTADAFIALFEQYNRAIWPAQLVASVFGLAAVASIFRPGSFSGRLVAGFLAAAWGWIGAVYHVGHFAGINFIAPLFGACFIAQALLFAWTGVVRNRVGFRLRPDLYGWTGLGLVVFAMAVYPLLAWLAGHGWPRMPMFGVTPCPTTIFTLGVLLLTDGRTPLHWLVIPLLWSLVGGSAAWLLGVPEDLALLLAGVTAATLVPLKNRRARPGHASAIASNARAHPTTRNRCNDGE